MLPTGTWNSENPGITNWYNGRQKYFEEHPEYFALIDGKRTDIGNHLCSTNPEVWIVDECKKSHYCYWFDMTLPMGIDIHATPREVAEGIRYLRDTGYIAIAQFKERAIRKFTIFPGTIVRISTSKMASEVLP